MRQRHIGRVMSRPDLPRRALAAARRSVAQRVGSRRGRGVVLLYHRVGDASRDPWNLTVTPGRFEEHLRLLSSEFHPLPLTELARGARHGRLPAGAVGVSFDDGYADNLKVAVPLLTNLRVPATVFVASGFVLNGRPFWWEELRAILLDLEPLPKMISFRLGGRELALRTATAAERQRALTRLQQAFQALPWRQVDQGLADLRSEAGLSGPAAVGERRALDPSELVRLAASDGVEVGAHTRNHPNLAHLPPDLVDEEIVASRTDLADVLDQVPETFSYPFGSHGSSARRAVRQAGFELAFGTAPTPVTWLSDRMELGRLWIKDIAADELEVQLRALLG